ncbi:MAG: hypothetical protein A2X36_15000 [Elusimicrobia bacterium GWA2_69_24]|nr:MAG: hypothetical protein A2X36_15000 [Elusimicrobia bacterium GWA2_69_24]
MRLSLLMVIYMSIVFFWLVVALFVYIGLFKSYHALRRSYRDLRKAVYQEGIEKVLMEEPLEQLVEFFRPRRWGDLDIIQEVLTESMRHLKGAPFDTLREVALKMGLIDHNLRRLSARSHHERGHALEALGLLRAPQAIVAIIDILDEETQDLRIVALRSLAAIGDPAALPYFVKACDGLPAPLLMRVASLMLEFGPISHRSIQRLINAHPEAFPPRILIPILKEIALDLEEARAR